MAQANLHHAPSLEEQSEQDRIDSAKFKSYRILLAALSVSFAIVFGWCAYVGFAFIEKYPGPVHQRLEASTHFAGSIVCIGALVMAIVNRPRLGWIAFTLAIFATTVYSIIELGTDL